MPARRPGSSGVATSAPRLRRRSARLAPSASACSSARSTPISRTTSIAAPSANRAGYEIDETSSLRASGARSIRSPSIAHGSATLRQPGARGSSRSSTRSETAQNDAPVSPRSHFAACPTTTSTSTSRAGRRPPTARRRRRAAPRGRGPRRRVARDPGARRSQDAADRDDRRAGVERTLDRILGRLARGPDDPQLDPLHLRPPAPGVGRRREVALDDDHVRPAIERDAPGDRTERLRGAVDDRDPRSLDGEKPRDRVAHALVRARPRLAVAGLAGGALAPERLRRGTHRRRHEPVVRGVQERGALERREERPGDERGRHQPSIRRAAPGSRRPRPVDPAGMDSL